MQPKGETVYKPIQCKNLGWILVKPLVTSYVQGLLRLFKWLNILPNPGQTCWHLAVIITKVNGKKLMTHTFPHLNWMSCTGLISTSIRKKSAYFLCALMHWCCQSHPSFNIISICNEYLTHSHFWKRYTYKTLSALILEHKYALLGERAFCVFSFFSLGKIQFHCD